MTQRERILSVYRGQTPDQVPFMLDLSHWFYHHNRLPWDISQSYDQPESELIRYHRQNGIGFYVPNLGSFLSADYGPRVKAETVKEDGPNGPEITWRLTTSSGSIARKRAWEEISYSWPITEWGVKTEQDLRVLGEALAERTFQPRWDRYEAWVREVGDIGVVYLIPGYSAMGYLLNYWMGVEEVMFAAADYPETLQNVVEQINASNLRLVDLLARSPAEIIILGDNFSSDIQPPRFFEKWSKAYYAEAIRRLHAAGKYVAVHIDGRLRGALAMIRDVGADCADAVTPTPMGDLTPRECREEAGAHFILSGGVAPNVWLPEVDTATFKKAVLEWLELRKTSPRLIANAGDQVPPGAVEDRIALMRDLVDKHGRY
jgi:uroporphyrinogen-III decarboxylase